MEASRPHNPPTLAAAGRSPESDERTGLLRESGTKGIRGEDILNLVAAREGHFHLESGHHSKLWLDLDPLFLQPTRVLPLVKVLAQALRGHAVTGICGPLVGGAFLAQTLASALDVEFFFTERVMPAERDGLYRAEYRLPRGLRGQVRGKRLAIVDDVISAGSAVRGTYKELREHGAQPAVAGALLLLGPTALSFFEQEGLPVEAATRLPYEIWIPSECPLCTSGIPLEDVTLPART
jgi:orotate phosphoribosyltransferase